MPQQFLASVQDAVARLRREQRELEVRLADRQLQDRARDSLLRRYRKIPRLIYSLMPDPRLLQSAAQP